MNFSIEELAVVALLLDEKEEKKRKILGSSHMDASRNGRGVCDFV